MESNWLPIPHTWREAVYLAVALILATTYKRIGNGLAGFWRNFRLVPAQADKIHAEAESIRTHDAVGTAQLIREMTISMGEASLLENKLKEKLASQESTITLQRLKIESLERRNAELEQVKVNGSAG
jgi:hypothetical protein